MKIKDILMIILCLSLLSLLVSLIAIVGFAQIDAEESCKDLTLKQCYNYCKSKTYLLGQDCGKIIRELKETREILGGSP